jgi:hypothetical protein
MTSRKNHQADATGHAVAIAQWDDDGGASMSPRSYTGAEISNDVSSKRRLAGDERFERARVPHYPIVMIAGRTKNRRTVRADRMATERKSRDEMFSTNRFDHQKPRRRPQYPPPPPKSSTNMTIIRINSMGLLPR